MTTVSQIISDAYRESNITALAGTPNDAQMAEGLILLQRVISSVYGFEIGDKLTNFPLGTNNVNVPGGFPPAYPINSTFLPLNVRIICNYLVAETVYLHPNPEDGSLFSFIKESGEDVTVNANGRKIDGVLSETLSDTANGNIWIYRADIGQWLLVNPLTADGEMPFPVEFDDLFVTSLAMRLNPRYTVATSPETQLQFKKAMGKFQSRYQQIIQVGSELGIVLTPGIRKERGYYYGYAYGTPTDVFNKGYPFIW